MQSGENEQQRSNEFIDNIENHKGRYYFHEVGSIVKKLTKSNGRRGSNGPPKDYTCGALTLAVRNWDIDDHSDDESLHSSALNSKDSGRYY